MKFKAGTGLFCSAYLRYAFLHGSSKDQALTSNNLLPMAECHRVSQRMDVLYTKPEKSNYLPVMHPPGHPQGARGLTRNR